MVARLAVALLPAELVSVWLAELLSGMDGEDNARAEASMHATATSQSAHSLRSELFSRIVLSGGSAAMPNLAARPAHRAIPHSHRVDGLLE